MADTKRVELGRVHELSIASLEDGARNVLMGRLAGILFLGLGAVTLASFASLPTGTQRNGTASIGVTAVIAGLIVMKLPWDRWPRSRSLWLVPPALALVSLGNAFGLDRPYDYGVFFVVVHVWIGLAHPPRTSLLFGPSR